MTSLKVFLWLIVFAFSLDLVCRLIFLSIKSYPRSVVWTKGMDAIRVIFCFAYVLWALYLLFMVIRSGA